MITAGRQALVITRDMRLLGLPLRCCLLPHRAYPLPPRPARLPLPQAGLLLAPLGALGTSLVSVNGVGYALLAIVLFTLKDAAARGRLGASTFKALNIGGRCRCCSAAAAAAVGAAVAPAVAAWQLSSAGTH